jgi:hypothetical protein
MPILLELGMFISNHVFDIEGEESGTSRPQIATKSRFNVINNTTS